MGTSVFLPQVDAGPPTGQSPTLHTCAVMPPVGLPASPPARGRAALLALPFPVFLAITVSCVYYVLDTLEPNNFVLASEDQSL